MLSIAVAIVAWAAAVARHEWFFADDFVFLAFAHKPQDWLANFIPLESRSWWSYRPLTTDVFFAIGYRLFRDDPYGYLVMSLSMHFLTGLVVYRLGRQFGFDVRAATLTALLSISRYASLTEGFWISVCQYTVTLFFYTFSLSLFFSFARSNRIVLQIASCVSMILALLSNEIAVTLAAVVVFVALYVAQFRLSTGSLVTIVRQTLPQLTIAVVYLIFRTRVISRADVPSLYHWTLGWQIPWNAFWASVYVFGRDPGALWVCVVPLLMALAALVTGGDRRRALTASLLGVVAVNLGWIIVILLPLVGMPSPHARFALPIEVPVCILLGAAVNAFTSVYARRHPVVVEALILAVLMIAFPYPAALDRPYEANGAPAKRFVTLLRQQYPNIQKGTTVVVLSDDVSANEADTFRDAIFGGAVLNAFFAEKELTLRILKEGENGDFVCPPCVFVRLKPGTLNEPGPKSPT